jgi:hypothetical protein
MSDCVVSAAAMDVARWVCCGCSGVVPISCILTLSYTALHTAVKAHIQHTRPALRGLQHPRIAIQEAQLEHSIVSYELSGCPDKRRPVTAFAALQCMQDWSNQRVVQRAERSFRPMLR